MLDAVEEFNFELKHHIGIRAGSQYEILENFETHAAECDIIICCYTEHARLYHKDGDP